jgi:two-component system, NtrC family, response regulator HydG
MNPTLIVLAGPLRGRTFVLSEPEFSIGREASNRFSVNDELVSRRHAVIKEESGRFTLVDLNSRNGTLVNAVPVQERTLQAGDRIQIGDSLLLFDLEASDVATGTTSVEFDDRELPTQSFVVLPRQDSLYLNLGQAHPEFTGRTVNDLRILLQICTEIASARRQVALQSRLLELIFDAIPADSGAILILDSDSSEPSTTAGWTRDRGSDVPVVVSRSVVRQVVQQRSALLANDVSKDEILGAHESIVSRRVHSILAVPIQLFEKLTGVIYLESKNPSIRFDEGHLQLMMGIAGSAAFALENARHLEWLESENERLKSDIKLQHDMVGESPRIREIYQFIAKAAPTESTVLIRGESGTGKELVAHAIHSNSPRAERPFVAINCAALTESLLESELFGHERGAFTGAIAQKRGKLEVADGGTVFLDEIGELAATLQAKLLRVLQERQFERVGGTRPIKVNIRLIAATNRDLEKAIQEGTFRQDLYYRLNVLCVKTPALRERREDIAILAGYFAGRFSKRAGRPIKGISVEARKCLTSYDWPGNVRELENAIERAIVLGSTDLIMAEDLPDAVLETQRIVGVQITEYHQAIKEAKQKLILQAFEQAGRNYAQAAKILGVHPNNLHRLIRGVDLNLPARKMPS